MKPAWEEAVGKMDGVDAIEDDGFDKLLGGHIIGPLVTEYENHVKSLTREVAHLKTALRSQNDSQRELMTENETLVKNLAVKQREYLKLIAESKKTQVIYLQDTQHETGTKPYDSAYVNQNS